MKSVRRRKTDHLALDFFEGTGNPLRYGREELWLALDDRGRRAMRRLADAEEAANRAYNAAAAHVDRLGGKP